MEFTNGTIFTHNGEVTIENPKTGNHRTFRIKTQPADSNFAPNQRILQMLNGPNNEFDYKPFAFVNSSKVAIWRKHRNKTNMTYISMLVHPESWKKKGVVYHFSEACRRCNRKLTTPESVKAGIGPICAQKQ